MTSDRKTAAHIPAPRSLGLVAGLLMAELIDACEKGQDHDADPVKVTCPKTGVTLNAGFYSRNREINRESSFSVLG